MKATGMTESSSPRRLNNKNMGFPFGSSTMLLLTFDLSSYSSCEKNGFDDDSFIAALALGTSSFFITFPTRLSESCSCTSIYLLSFSIYSLAFIVTFR